MDYTAAGFGIVALGLLVGGLILSVMLIIAPLKLFGIHREAKRTNELLTHMIAEQARAQAAQVHTYHVDAPPSGFNR